MMGVPRLFKSVVFGVSLGILAVVSPSLDLIAQARRSTLSPLINPISTTEVAALFVAGGAYRYSGGVLFQGKMHFYREVNGVHTRLQMSDLALTADKTGAVSVNYRGRAFRLELHKGLACPLGRFVERDGLIAYSIPFEVNAEIRQRLTSAGLVRAPVSTLDRQVFVAAEFSRSVFFPLLDQADFFDVEDLPGPLHQRLVDAINRAVGPSRSVVRPTSWYLNVDNQITYQGYLLDNPGRIEVAGVPLRYYWSFASDGSGIVDSVKAMSQRWERGLLDLDREREPTQYDVVVLYQAAALFRQFAMADRPAFRRFVSASCT